MRRPQLQRRHIHHSPRHEARRMTENSSPSVTTATGEHQDRATLRHRQTHRHMRRAERQQFRPLETPTARGVDRRPAPISGIRRDEVEIGRAGVLARGPLTSKRRDRLPPPCFFLASSASISDRLCWSYHNRQLCDMTVAPERARNTTSSKPGDNG
jgi:hypothetical protein